MQVIVLPRLPVRPIVRYIHDWTEFERYMRPFAYSPDKTNLFALAGIRATCKYCGTFQICERFNFEMDKGLICKRCGAFTAGYVIPDGAQGYFLTPWEFRQIGYN